MFVLVVEDDPTFVLELSDTIRKLPGEPQISIARSRDSAAEYLTTSFFDVIILDLRIPTTDGALDADVRHGHTVFALSRTLAPGTPIRVLTGSPAEDFIPDLLASQQQMDIWGEQRKVGTVDFLQKYRFKVQIR
jgi:CheY-like chemotaxis protein